LDRGRPAAASFRAHFPEIAETEARYVVRGRAVGGGRTDRLSSRRRTGSLCRCRPGHRHPCRRHGPVGLLGAIARLASKFGPVDLVDFTIGSSASGQAGGVRRCFGFARCADEQRLRMIGWYCNAGPNLVDRATIACALDRLTLQSAAGGSPAARVLCVRRARTPVLRCHRHAGCGGAQAR